MHDKRINSVVNIIELDLVGYFLHNIERAKKRTEAIIEIKKGSTTALDMLLPLEEEKEVRISYNSQYTNPPDKYNKSIQL